jgi:hypothetical protein
LKYTHDPHPVVKYYINSVELGYAQKRSTVATFLVEGNSCRRDLYLSWELCSKTDTNYKLDSLIEKVQRISQEEETSDIEYDSDYDQGYPVKDLRKMNLGKTDVENTN